MYVCMYVIMKTMCPPGYHHNGIVATHVPKCMSSRGHIVFMITYILRSSCFCEI